MSKKIKELELNALRDDVQGRQGLRPARAAQARLGRRLRDSARSCARRRSACKMVKNTLVKKVFDENGVQGRPGRGPTLLVLGRGQHQGTRHRGRRDAQGPRRRTRRRRTSSRTRRRSRTASRSRSRSPRRCRPARRRSAACVAAILGPACRDRRLPRRPGEPARRHPQGDRGEGRARPTAAPAAG